MGGKVRIFRHPDALWREEDAAKDAAMQGIESGRDVSEMGTSIVLLHGKMHALNLLGTEIWKSCEGRDIDEIIDTVQEGFDVDRSVLKEDVLSFLSELRELGLIHER